MVYQASSLLGTRRMVYYLGLSRRRRHLHKRNPPSSVLIVTSFVHFFVRSIGIALLPVVLNECLFVSFLLIRISKFIY